MLLSPAKNSCFSTHGTTLSLTASHIVEEDGEAQNTRFKHEKIPQAIPQALTYTGGAVAKARVFSFFFFFSHLLPFLAAACSFSGMNLGWAASLSSCVWKI